MRRRAWGMEGRHGGAAVANRVGRRRAPPACPIGKPGVCVSVFRAWPVAERPGAAVSPFWHSPRASQAGLTHRGAGTGRARGGQSPPLPGGAWPRPLAPACRPFLTLLARRHPAFRAGRGGLWTPGPAPRTPPSGVLLDAQCPGGARGVGSGALSPPRTPPRGGGSAVSFSRLQAGPARLASRSRPPPPHPPSALSSSPSSPPSASTTWKTTAAPCARCCSRRTASPTTSPAW